MKNIKYAIEDIIRRPFIFFIIIIQIVVATMILSTGLCWNIKTMDTVSRTKNMFKGKEVYQLSENTDKNYLENSINKADGMDRMYELYTFLRESSDFSICAKRNTSIYIKDFVDNDRFYKHNSDDKKYLDNPYTNIEGRFSNVYGVYVDEGYMKEFPLEVSKGRTFEKQDYSAEVMPVILGAGYEGIYNIGDTFEYFDYINLKVSKIEVVGILKSNTYIFETGTTILVDDYVICPYQNITTSNANKLMYSTWIENCLIVTNDKEKSLEEIGEKSTDLELYNFKLSSCKGITTKIVESMNEEAGKSISLSVSIFLFVSIGIIAVQLNSIKNRQKEFGIHLLSGARKRDIGVRILLSISVYVILGTCIGTYFGYTTNKEIYDKRVILFLIPIMILLIIIISILPLNKIRKMEVTDIIRREE